MKQDTLIIVCALVIIMMITALCAHVSAIGEKDRQITEMTIAQNAERNALQAQILGLQQELQPEPYSQPLDELWISSEMGYRVPPLGGVGADETLHKGIDFSAPEGTPVYSVISGTVREHWLPPDGGVWKGHPILGGMITIESPRGFFVILAHLSTTYVHEDEWVEMGQIVGRVGSTGKSSAPHLHMECVVNPLTFLSGLDNNGIGHQGD